MAYLIFRCNCGRHLYIQENAKSRTCPCGKKNSIDRVVILARAIDDREAGEMVRTLQMAGKESTGFRRAADRLSSSIVLRKSEG